MTARRGDHGSGTGAERGVPRPRLAGSGIRAAPPSGAQALSAGLADLPGDLRAAATPGGVQGVAMEMLWTAAHFALYPFGVFSDRHEVNERYHLGDLAPHQRGLVMGDVEAAGTPILLVHGLVDNRMIFTLLRRRLRRRGFGRVFTINYPPITNDIRAAARDLSGAIEELVARTGYERIHVIGHSLGGLIARYYVQRLGGDERVHTLVTLGTPHAGALLAYALPVQLGRQLRPGSDLYQELALRAVGCRTRFIAYYSDLDQVIVPHAHGRLDHPDLIARNVVLHAVGHMSLPIHRTVVREIGQVLSQLDTQGASLTAGITPLSSPAS